jgi:hypothetical protein
MRCVLLCFVAVFVVFVEVCGAGECLGVCACICSGGAMNFRIRLS